MKIHIPKILIATGLMLAPAMSQAQLANGLLNYWPLDGNASDTASSYPGATGTTVDNGQINGTVTFSAGQTGFGQAGNFPGGGGNNITVADPDGGTNDIDRSGADLSISIWLKLNNIDTGWQAVIAHGEGTDYRLAYRDGSNPVQYAWAGGGAGSDIESTTGFGATPGGDGNWHHVVATTQGSVTNLYVNGVLEASGGTGPINENGQNLLCIGCNPTNGREWNGQLDDVAMWDRALSAAEVAQIYNGGIAGSALSDLLIDPDDDDNDGLPNSWEVLYGLDPNDDGSMDINNGPLGDPDMDNVSNLDEFNNGTFPNDADSDDDNLTDDIETDTGTWNSDIDRGTDPLNEDSDNDGLRDDYENNNNVYVDETQTGTDPNVPDSDADNIPDGYESANGLDPNLDDAAADPDADTLSNLQEYQGRDNNPNSGDETDPQDDDTDDDNLRDDYEDNTGTYVSATQTGTNPVVADTDGDGLLDGSETNDGNYDSPTDTGSNPHATDSDGDGTHDGAEVIGGRDPNVADGVTEGLGKKLLAYWNFDNNLDDIAHTLPGESMVADNGTFTGPETDVNYAAEGLFGSSALEQNGGAGWVTVPSSVDTLREIDNAVSVSAWVKVAGLDVSWQAIIAHGEGNQWRMARRAEESTVAWAGGAGDIPGENIGPDIQTDGGWHHVVGVSDPVAGSTAIYVDGSLVATGNAPNLQNKRGGDAEIPDLFIGNNPQALSREWNGQIDDVAVWGRGLTQAEVTEIFEAGVSLGDLLGGGAGLKITDISFDRSVGANGEFSITFNSTTGASYGLYFSTDLVDFSADVDDDITGEDGSTTYTFPNPDPGSDKLFFRVQRN